MAVEGLTVIFHLIANISIYSNTSIYLPYEVMEIKNLQASAFGVRTHIQVLHLILVTMVLIQ